MTKKHIKTLKEDAQYLEEFYVWNKERHPEWDGTYVLELVEEKRSIAETQEKVYSLFETWREILRADWQKYKETIPLDNPKTIIGFNNRQVFLNLFAKAKNLFRSEENVKDNMLIITEDGLSLTVYIKTSVVSETTYELFLGRVVRKNMYSGYAIDPDDGVDAYDRKTYSIEYEE